MKNVVSGEIDGVSAVPQEPLLSRVEMNVDVNSAGFEGKRHLAVDLFLVHHFPAIYPTGGAFCLFNRERRCGWRLLLRRAPGRRDRVQEFGAASVPPWCEQFTG